MTTMYSACSLLPYCTVVGSIWGAHPDEECREEDKNDDDVHGLLPTCCALPSATAGSVSSARARARVARAHAGPWQPACFHAAASFRTTSATKGPDLLLLAFCRLVRSVARAPSKPFNAACSLPASTACHVMAAHGARRAQYHRTHR